MKYGILAARQVAFLDTTLTAYASLPYTVATNGTYIINGGPTTAYVGHLGAGVHAFAYPCNTFTDIRYVTMTWAGVGVETVTATVTALDANGNNVGSVAKNRSGNGSTALQAADFEQLLGGFSGNTVATIGLTVTSTLITSGASVTMSPFLAMQQP